MTLAFCDIRFIGHCSRLPRGGIDDRAASDVLSGEEMRRLNIKSAAIAQHRPGTVKGLIFLTLEDETGNASVIVMPDIYEKYRRAVLEPRFIRV